MGALLDDAMRKRALVALCNDNREMRTRGVHPDADVIRLLDAGETSVPVIAQATGVGGYEVCAALFDMALGPHETGFADRALGCNHCPCRVRLAALRALVAELLTPTPGATCADRRIAALVLSNCNVKDVCAAMQLTVDEARSAVIALACQAARQSD